MDNIPHLAVFVTGSSAFDLKNKIAEPLLSASRWAKREVERRKDRETRRKGEGNYEILGISWLVHIEMSGINVG